MFEDFGKNAKQKKEHVRKITNIRRQGETSKGNRSWDTFNSDTYQHSFGEIISDENLRMELSELKEDETIVFGVDIMGQGNPCIKVGCEHAVALTLNSEDEHTDKELSEQLKQNNVNAIFGDAFDKDTAQHLIDKVQEYVSKKEKLGLVYFRPLGGLEAMNIKAFDYVYAFLIQHYLQPLYKILSPGGSIFVDITGFSTPEVKQMIEKRIERLDNAEVTFSPNYVLTFRIKKNT